MDYLTYNRLLDERDQIINRTSSLQTFLDHGCADDLDEFNRQLLIDQLTYMKMYRDILLRRICLNAERSGLDCETPTPHNN